MKVSGHGTETEAALQTAAPGSCHRDPLHQAETNQTCAHRRRRVYNRFRGGKRSLFSQAGGEESSAYAFYQTVRGSRVQSTKFLWT